MNLEEFQTFCANSGITPRFPTGCKFFSESHTFILAKTTTTRGWLYALIDTETGQDTDATVEYPEHFDSISLKDLIKLTMDEPELWEIAE